MKTYLLSFLACLALAGCESLNTFLQSPAGKVAASLVLQAGTQYGMSGFDGFDKVWGISHGLYTIAGSIPLGAEGEKIIKQTAIEYAGKEDINTRKLADKLVKAYKTYDPQTAKQAKDAVNALARDLQKAAAKGERHD